MYQPGSGQIYGGLATTIRSSSETSGDMLEENKQLRDLRDMLEEVLRVPTIRGAGKQCSGLRVYYADLTKETMHIKQAP